MPKHWVLFLNFTWNLKPCNKSKGRQFRNDITLICLNCEIILFLTCVNINFFGRKSKVLSRRTSTLKCVCSVKTWSDGWRATHGKCKLTYNLTFVTVTTFKFLGSTYKKKQCENGDTNNNFHFLEERRKNETVLS